MTSSSSQGSAASGPLAGAPAERLALLRRATATLSSSAGVEDRLAALANLLVPALADWCSVSVVEDDGGIRRVALVAADEADRELAGSFGDEHAQDPAASTGISAVIKTGESLLYRRIDDDVLRTTALSDDYYDLTSRMGLASAVLVPLRARGRTLGALSLLTSRSGRHYDEDDLAFAEELGRWVALTLENARLLEDARRAGRRFRELVDRLDVVVWEGRPALPPRPTYVSSRVEELFGRPAAHWLAEGQDLLRPVDPDDLSGLLAAWREALAGGGRHTFEYRVLLPEGHRRWVQERVEILPGEDGEPDRVLGLIVDVTGERVAASRLGAQYAVTRALAEARGLDDALPAVLEAVCSSLEWSVSTFWEATTAGVMRFVTAWQAPGVDAGDFLSTAAQLELPWGAVLAGKVWADRRPVWIADVTADEQFYRARDAARAGLRGGLGFPVTSGGRVIGVMEFFTPRIREPEPAVMEMLGSVGAQVGQFLERLRMQDEASFRAALLKAQSDTGAEAQLVVSPEGRMLSCNRRFIEMWSVPAQIVESGDGAACLEVMRAQVVDPDGFLERIRRLYAETPRDHADELHLRDGRIIERYGAPLTGDDGTYYGWAWYHRDVTAERRTAQELRESRGRFASLARTLQASLLPPRTPVVPGLDVAARYRAVGEGIEVGGDFYDVFPVGDDAWGIVIGDVSGKGPAAAALTALARYTIRASASRRLPPSDVLAELNEAILREGHGERFCTVLYLQVSPSPGGRVAAQLSIGGHPRPAVVRADGTTERVGRIGMLIGALPDADLYDDSLDLAPGDGVVLCTDGVLEARSPAGDLFGSERLLAALKERAGEPAGTLADALVDAVVGFAGEPRDDVAIVVLRVPH